MFDLYFLFVSFLVLFSHPEVNPSSQGDYIDLWSFVSLTTQYSIACSHFDISLVCYGFHLIELLRYSLTLLPALPFEYPPLCRQMLDSRAGRLMQRIHSCWSRILRPVRATSLVRPLFRRIARGNLAGPRVSFDLCCHLIRVITTSVSPSKGLMAAGVRAIWGWRIIRASAP